MSEATPGLTPALSPKQWEFGDWRDEDTFIDGNFGDAIIVGNRNAPDADSDVHLIGPAALCALMALANYQLPANHPAKITREDVEAILKCADFTGGPEGDQAELAAGKLRSILPPP